MKTLALVNSLPRLAAQFAFLFILLALFLYAGTARAEETAVSSDTSNAASVGRPPLHPLPYPLDKIKDEVKNLLPKNIIPPEVREAKERLASTTKAVEERRNELEKMKERALQAQSGVKERIASTTQMLRERAGEANEKIKEKVASTTNAIKARAEERVKMELKRTVGLITAAIERLQTLIGRIESRAEKLAEAGADVSGVRTDVAAAKTELDSAKADLESIRSSSVSVLRASNLAAAAMSLQNVRATLQSARDHVKKAEIFVRSAVEKLKVAAGTVRADATN